MATLAAVDKRVVEERLTCRESVVTGHTAVLKVATRFNAFVSALAAASAAGSGAGAELVAAHDALAKELMLMRLELDKARAVLEQQPAEREEFERYVELISSQTAKAEQEIGALKEQLAVARAVRQQREEYEAMAKLVNEFPAEAASRKAQAALDAEVRDMAAEEARLREALAFRRRQLAFVVNAVADLKAGLEHDLRVEEERERYLGEKEKEERALLSAVASGGDALDGTGQGEADAAMDDS